MQKNQQKISNILSNLFLRKMKNKKFKNLVIFFSFSIVIIFVLAVSFSIFEPQITGAAAATDDVNVNLTVSPTISITYPSDVSMGTITGTGSATGSTTWTVTTNNSSGWKLEVAASAAPAMASGADNFSDYTEAAELTPETWSIASSASEFGFGATGTFIESKFGTNKYMGFNGTAKEQVSHSGAETAGDDTTLIFKAEVGSSKAQPTGNYSATVTATATSL